MLKSKRQRLEEAEDEESDYERRSENEKRGNSKLFDLLEGTHLVVRDEKKYSEHQSSARRTCEEDVRNEKRLRGK